MLDSFFWSLYRCMERLVLALIKLEIWCILDQ